MSWNNVWPLPRAGYAKDEIERAVAKTIAEFGVKRLPDQQYPDWEEDESDGDDAQFAFRVSIPRRLRELYGDQPGEAGDCECVFTVMENILGDDTERWEVCVHSNDEQNREANMAVAQLAAKVSMLLGGPEEPETI